MKVWRREEGFRDGSKSGYCPLARVKDSFAKISIPPGCPGDPHSNGMQGLDGPPLTVDNVTIDFNETTCAQLTTGLCGSEGHPFRAKECAGVSQQRCSFGRAALAEMADARLVPLW